jgi:hypothetical protein
VVFHRKYRNMGLQAFGQSFQIGDDGRLSPDPDAATEAAFEGLANYKLVPAKAVPAKAAPVGGSSVKEAPATEQAKPPKKPAAKKRRPRPAKK